MRTDFTAQFLTHMQAASRRPRQLAVFHFPKAGDVYVSDQALGASDGLSNEYAALVEDWGDLTNSGDPKDPMASEICQMTLTLWNGGSPAFSEYFNEEDPEDVLVDLYQWAKGLSEASMALIDKFVCQDPIATDEASRLVRIDLVSLPMRYDGPVGDVIKIADWPNCKEEDIGKYIPIVFGSPGYVRAICVRTAPKATLCGSILEDTLEIVANEDLDAEGFSQSGIIQIGAERISYSSRTEIAFYVTQRGADGTIAAEHLNQEEIQQHVTDFTYIISRGPVSSIGDVKVGGLLAPGSIYTTYPALNPARVVFSEKPYGLDYAKGSTFLEMQFDATAADNTAIQPHLAYDPASVTSAAKINKTYSKLSLTQVTVNADRGEIVKVYLAVEWWASAAALQHDRVKVTLNGAVLGYLERPSQEDQLSLDAEVDIDHGHSHSISGEHQHPFSDPAYGTSETPHGHASTNLSQQIRCHAGAQVSLPLNGSVRSATIQGRYPYSAATVHFRTSPEYGCGFSLYSSSGFTGGGVGESNFAISPSGGTVTVYFKWLGATQAGISIMVYDIWIDYVIDSAVEPAYTGVSVSKVAGGAMDGRTDKAATDVQDLAAENRALTVNAASTPTKSVVELFDITTTVNQDWGWFTSKNVQVEYEGAVDDVDFYVLHVFFDIEYRRVERTFSDEVTADVQGLIDDGSGTYTGTPDALITRPDHVRRYLLQACGGLPVGYIDDTSFAAAGARYAAKDYGFDGVLEGDLTVRDAEKKLARECRSRWFWDAGKAMIKFREIMADWTIAKEIVSSTGALRLKGASMERKAIRNMVNRVHLYYYRDWSKDTTGIEAYLGMATAQHNESIASHGIREDAEGFMFDLVRNVSMAQDLADYYKEAGALSTFYTFEAFLPYIDLQKEDYLRITHSFMNLQKAAMRIASIQRVFGSGKIGRMNMLRIIAETWYRLIKVAKQDTVKVSDLLHIDFQFNDFIQNGVGVSDVLRFGFNFDEEVSVGEALAIVMAFVVSQTETVSCGDSLAAHMEVAVSDDVTVAEFLDGEIGRGFGMGSFGEDKFGSLSMMDHNPVEYISALDELTVVLNAVLADTVTCTDELLFSSGFGSPWAEDDGFGEEPFGS